MMEARLKELIKRHAFLEHQNGMSDSRAMREAMDRIEQQYIELTGYPINENEEHKKLLEQYEI